MYMKSILLVTMLTFLVAVNGSADNAIQSSGVEHISSFSTTAKLATPAEKATKHVLLMDIGHTNKRRLNLLEQSLGRFNIAVSTHSAKELDHARLIELMAMYDLILLEGMSQLESQKSFGRYADIFEKDKTTSIISLRDPKGEANANITADQAQALAAYYINGGRENFKNLGIFVASSIFSLSNEQAATAIPMPGTGYYHPTVNAVHTHSAEQDPAEALIGSDSSVFFKLLSRQNDKPMVAVTFHRAALETDNMEVIDGLIARLESMGAFAYGVFEQSIDAESNYLSLLMDPLAKPDIVINYRTIHYAEKHRQEFAKLNIPVIQAINYQGTVDEYRADHSGISPMMTAFFLVMPETAGTINPVILAANSDKGRKAAIPEQLDILAERAVKHARLAHLENGEKKIGRHGVELPAWRA